MEHESAHLTTRTLLIVRGVGAMGLWRRHDTRQAAMGLARAPASRHSAQGAICMYFNCTFTLIHSPRPLFCHVLSAQLGAKLKTIKAISYRIRAAHGQQLATTMQQQQQAQKPSLPPVSCPVFRQSGGVFSAATRSHMNPILRLY